MLTITEETLDQIPVLHICKEEYIHQPLPVIIFWHGFTSGKEHNLHIAYHLAKKNIRVILPEALHHGVRDSGLTEKERVFQFWSIVLQSVRETKQVWECLQKRKLIEENRVFVAGTSMGGIITCGVLAAYPWVKGGAVLMGNPAWETFARQQIRLMEQQGSLPLTEEEAEKQVSQLIPFDLSQQTSAIANRPLFFWHGKRDEVVPYLSSYEFYEQIKEKRKDDDSLVYHLDPAAGHKVSRDGMLLMAEWTADYI
ncbi:serine aminopeptidase domain-containing protein [Alteribacillus iranensis]|uniref:Peptidase S9 prolyl oligopeptidase catalytic domain-containing protein n=1 Tax=Alteribacillus iranensis TaxID=930128 RepID=A0A1I2CWN6_9BACI|nr:alpha/beta hydrolase [Alteribacillus iranensis]SFE72689.1 hypothetical protein SAMN05192532_103252 [Alteribacillus iranensis]